MAIKHVGGSGRVPEGKVMTTRGLQDRQPPICWTCHQRKEGQIYGISVNGAPICADCASKPRTEECDCNGECRGE